MISSVLFILLLASLFTILSKKPPATANELVPVLSVAFSTAAAGGVCCLSFIHHRRSIQPSDPITFYLLASIICDILWMSFPGPNIHSLQYKFTLLAIVGLVIKFVLLVFECQGKQFALYRTHRKLSPEETGGRLHRTLFWWINALLSKGLKTSLEVADLPVVDRNLSSDALRKVVLRTWDRRGLCFPYLAVIDPLTI